jgi:hypothetical protein
MKNYFRLMFALMLFGAITFTACGGDDSSDNTPATYAIGKTGPSGVGIVFYVTDGGLHGLEAAPENWNPNGSGDPTPVWIIGGSTQTTYIGTPAGIGTGLANSNTIISQSGHTNSAAKVCRDYTGGGKTDWFLPSKDELEQLYLHKSAVGNFDDIYYWSSTDNYISLPPGIVALTWDFTEPDHSFALYAMKKENTSSVRPVRAF